MNNETQHKAEQFEGHTPGPWKYIDRPGAGLEIQAILGPSEKRRDFAEYVLRGDVPVSIFCAVWAQFPSQEWNAMQKANAALIASAPTLLKENQELKTDLKAFTQILNEMFKWAKVKDGKATFSTSEETWNMYKKYVSEVESQYESKTEKP